MVRRSKILTRIFIIILLFLGITVLTGNTEIYGLIGNTPTSIYDSYNGHAVIQYNGLGAIYSNPRLYCIEHGDAYDSKRTYMLYEYGQLNSDEVGRQLAYLIAKHSKSLTDHNGDTSENDPASNAVWDLIGEQGAVGMNKRIK